MHIIIMFMSFVTEAPFYMFKPMFHCDAKLLASGLGVGGNAKKNNMLVYFGVTPNAKPKICITPGANPDTSQWNIGGVGSSGIGHVYFMYISCIFHVVCASFSALATRELADANPVSSGIWALI